MSTIKEKQQLDPDSSTLTSSPLPTSTSSSNYQFSPSSAIDRFLALRTLAASESSILTPPTSESSNIGSPSTKRQRTKPAGHVNIPCRPHPATPAASQSLPNLELTKQRQRSKQTTKERVEPRSNANSRIPTSIYPLLETDDNDIVSQSRSPVRPDEPLPSLTKPDIHRYIVSTRLLQNTAIIRALVDPNCGRAELIERDVEYLRALLSEDTASRSTTRVEADIILDENNAVVLYSLREIGQAIAQDPDAGLNELVAILGRIGPRYKVVWLILEEYSWAKLPPYVTKRSSSASRGSSVCPSRSTPAKESVNIKSVDKTTNSTRNSKTTPTESPTSNSKPTVSHTTTKGGFRLDPYVGPVMVQLKKLMAWVQTTHDRQGWWARRSNNSGGNSDLQSILYDPFLSGFSGISELRFETRVLFASDERCTAWISRAIGDAIADKIEKLTKAGIRREEDGWRDREEWIWRDWLNERDSTVSILVLE
ncbi:hypothetical protein BGZ80_009789 [Entomortierella chlamydospora]|uniref:Uncharacterized protein n=1 Tax=Entomortierella chlamydospora TaxID=101097 RepID=A0A9P6MWI9_9FUNG|nr:hypothetical protein BGZ80_009789 [Entomortierella chlamydospora]